MNTTETAQRATEAASRAQDVATQVKDQALTLVDEARDLAHGLASEVAERTGRKKPGMLRRFGSSLRHHPVRWTLGLGAAGGAAYALMQKKQRGSMMSATSGAPAYGAGAPGQRTQDGPVTDMQSEAELTPQNEPANR